MGLIRTILEPGLHESTGESVEGDAECVFQFDAALGVLLGWDDPDLRVTLDVWRSRDNGQTWAMVRSADFVGGSRGKRDVGLPDISVVPVGDDTALRGQYKIAMTTNRRLSVGIETIRRR